MTDIVRSHQIGMAECDQQFAWLFKDWSTAAELPAELGPQGAGVISGLNLGTGVWYTCSEQDGEAAPGSKDFAILPGDVVFIRRRQGTIPEIEALERTASRYRPDERPSLPAQSRSASASPRPQSTDTGLLCP